MNTLAYGLSAGLSLALPLLIAAVPNDARPVIVVASPWSAPAEMFAIVGRADGRLLRGTALPWVAVAVSDQAAFAGRLRRAGAWMTLNASPISGCLPASPP